MGIGCSISQNSQKCLSCVPGLSPLTFSDKVLLQKIKEEYFNGTELVHRSIPGFVIQVGQIQSYHHTAPINSIFALHEALRLACLER